MTQPDQPALTGSGRFHGLHSHVTRRWPQWFAALAIAFFLILVGRSWHPVYHFTAFLQLAEEESLSRVSALNSAPAFLYPGTGGYDGQYYAQIASDPSLRSDELPSAIDNVAYRARRILGPALAWALAFGDPARAIQTYSFLNVLCWLVLATLTWRLLAVASLRSAVAWAGLMFSAGALHSVRLALTDLVALTFLAGGFLALEVGRRAWGAGLLALSGLGRETSLGAGAGAWDGPWNSLRTWIRNALLSVVIILPTALWFFYISRRFPDTPANPSVFTTPGLGLLEKLQSIAAALRTTNDHFLTWSTLLAILSILAQAIYLLARPKFHDRWWRAGIPYVVLVFLLNRDVWDGDPGAITRVMLPLQLAFNVLASRHRAPLVLLILGNLSFLSGLAPFRGANADSRELGYGHVNQTAIVVRSADGWHLTENTWSQSRTWSQARSHIQFKAWPQSSRTSVAITFKIRAITPRTITVRQNGKTLWEAHVGVEKQPVRIEGIHITPEINSVEFSSDLPAQAEGPDPSARQLSFAIYDLSVISAP